MRAAIYNPYLDTLGGGERYTCAFAEVLVKNGYTVDVQWKDVGIKEILESRFGISLNGVDIVKDVKRGDGYDLCFWVSDGSVPMLRARNNLLHFQVPFHGVGGRSLMNKMKLFRINKIICNSDFTENVIDKEFGVGSVVIYPPVDTEGIKPKRKENLILFVGRFSQILQNKGQDVLVRAFKKMCDGGLTGWKLILAGGVEVGAGDYPEKLRQSALGYPIEIIESPDYKTLKNLYGIAKIFWSASGYGENEEKNPEKVEHFGITVVEAMAAKAVPVVYGAGGHKEIVTEGENGLIWNTPINLIKKTRSLIADSKLLNEIAYNAKKSAEKYSEKAFENNIVSNILQK
jgi:glycosyltransferase involved in cell wall biosynthesis